MKRGQFCFLHLHLIQVCRILSPPGFPSIGGLWEPFPRFLKGLGEKLKTLDFFGTPFAP